MKLKVRSGKQNRHEKIAVVLLSGEPVSPDDIKACFKDTDQEAVLYRLATNIYNIRRDGGVIRVHKDGRKVSAYQLLNPKCFNAEGRYIGFTSTNDTSVTHEVVEQTETETVYA